MKQQNERQRKRKRNRERKATKTTMKIEFVNENKRKLFYRIIKYCFVRVLTYYEYKFIYLQKKNNENVEIPIKSIYY